jgi:hypothetical protein
MSDTDLPGMGGLEPAPRRPRPIASPFGALASPPPGLINFRPPSTPGFNVGAPTPAGWLPADALSNLAANLTPSRQGIAETLGAPMDAIAWALHRAGLPISGDESYASGAFQRDPFSGRPTWTPSASVPFGSQHIRGVLDNGPSFSLDALLQAMRRPGLF